MSDVTIDLEPDPTDKPPRAIPTCDVCGREIPYSGRGRPPKRHRECKSGSDKSGSAATGTSRGNANAEQAADTLDNLYAVLAFGFSTLGCKDAADAVNSQRKKLREDNARYLTQNRKLARAINKGNEATGTLGFLAANAMVLGPALFMAGQELVSRHNDQKQAKRERSARPTTGDNASVISLPGIGFVDPNSVS